MENRDEIYWSLIVLILNQYSTIENIENEISKHLYYTIGMLPIVYCSDNHL